MEGLKQQQPSEFQLCSIRHLSFPSSELSNFTVVARFGDHDWLLGIQFVSAEDCEGLTLDRTKTKNFYSKGVAIQFRNEEESKKFHSRIYLKLSTKMWGPGTEQVGIIQSSACKLDLKESYCRMSPSPKSCTSIQDQQSNQSLQQQVKTDIVDMLVAHIQVSTCSHDLQVLPQDIDEEEWIMQQAEHACRECDSITEFFASVPDFWS